MSVLLSGCCGFAEAEGCLFIFFAGLFGGLPEGAAIRPSTDPPGNPAVAAAQANDSTFNPALSGDGRFIAVESLATNLDGRCADASLHVFVVTQSTGQATCVSRAPDGSPGNAESFEPRISADGRHVAFTSSASNLVPGDTNDRPDVFVHDRQTGLTTRVSVASDGTPGNSNSFSPALSADGRFVAFASFASNLVLGDDNTADVFVHDRQTGETTRVSVASDGTPGNDSSRDPALSADGRFVAFSSFATNLVAGDTNGVADIFVHDRQTGQTTRVSVASDGTEATGGAGIRSFTPAISGDGQIVAFISNAANLVPGDTNADFDVFVHDRVTGATTVVGRRGARRVGEHAPALSADGSLLAFEGPRSNAAASVVAAATRSLRTTG